MNQTSLQAQTKRFAAFLRDQNLKITPERIAVLEAILTHQSHFEAEDLLIQMRQQGVHVSKATIYRTLPLLVRAGVLREVIVGERHAHYEIASGPRSHDHMICLNCGQIIEFQDAALEKALQQVSDSHQFLILHRTLEMHGYCGACRPSDS